MREFIVAGFVAVSVTLSGCSTVADYKPKLVDGHEYIMGAPVVAKGIVEELRVTGKDGAVQKITAGGSDLASVSVGTSLASAIGGGSSLGGGAALGIVGALLDVVAAANAPRIEFMVRRDPEGDLVNVPVPNKDYVRIIEKYHCVSLGDAVRVVKLRGRLDIYNAQPELLRLSDFQPSCQDMKSKLTQSGGEK